MSCECSDSQRRYASGWDNQARGHQHLRGRPKLRRLGDTELGLLHEARLADSLNPHSSPRWGYVTGVRPSVHRTVDELQL